MIHNVTEGGVKGVEFFELKEGESVEKKIGIFKHFKGNGFVGEQIDDLRRMFTDSEFRNQMYKGYQKTVQPRVGKYSLRDVFDAMIR